MADLFIPAALRTWLVFLLVFIFLGYKVPFSILFGFIGGIAGGLTTAWWQVKGKKSPSEPKDTPFDEIPADDDEDQSDRDKGNDSRWELPFLGPSKARTRYVERNRRSRNRRIR